MPIVRINGVPYEAQNGERLSALLARCGIAAEHPCGGRGVCGKCAVTVNGSPALSCQFIIAGDAEVSLQAPAAIAAEGGTVIATETSCAPLTDVCDLVLDLGTTTLALAAVASGTGELCRVLTANNPQRAFGADIMSRIEYARTHGVEPLAAPLRAELNRLIAELTADIPAVPDHLYVAGNTTMLHLLLGVDPTPMGTAPYTPAFLDERRVPATLCGLHGVREVVTLPGFAAFVGADLVAGLHYVGLPPTGKYRLLVDLGTNAEILLIGRDRILCTAAAAGPCFEGACISCGMSATPGAICAYEADGTYTTIPGADGAADGAADGVADGAADDTEVPPRGLCGTGLVDAVAVLLDTAVIDETGYMEQDIFYLTDTVGLTQEDVRQYQLAKSAVAAAIEALLHTAGLDYTAIDRLCIAGGFAAKLNIASAVRTSLLPAALADRCVAVGNTSLLGAALIAAAPADLTAYTRSARYVDLAADPYFAERFMEGMLFA